MSWLPIPVQMFLAVALFMAAIAMALFGPSVGLRDIHPDLPAILTLVVALYGHHRTHQVEGRVQRLEEELKKRHPTAGL